MSFLQHRLWLQTWKKLPISSQPRWSKTMLDLWFKRALCTQHVLDLKMRSPKQRKSTPSKLTRTARRPHLRLLLRSLRNPLCTDQAGAGEDTMKVLIDEANRMLKTLQHSDPKESKEKYVSPKTTEDKMTQLQKQLDELKKATMRPFRLSRLGCSKACGLLDSGATHPLRAR